MISESESLCLYSRRNSRPQPGKKRRRYPLGLQGVATEYHNLRRILQRLAPLSRPLLPPGILSNRRVWLYGSLQECSVHKTSCQIGRRQVLAIPLPISPGISVGFYYFGPCLQGPVEIHTLSSSRIVVATMRPGLLSQRPNLQLKTTRTSFLPSN